MVHVVASVTIVLPSTAGDAAAPGSLSPIKQNKYTHIYACFRVDNINVDFWIITLLY